MWYLIYGSVGHRTSMHGNKVGALTAACQLLKVGQEVKEVGEVGGPASEVIGADRIRRLAQTVKQRGVDAPTAALIAATLGALILVLIPGDQIGQLLSATLDEIRSL